MKRVQFKPHIHKCELPNQEVQFESACLLLITIHSVTVFEKDQTLANSVYSEKWELSPRRIETPFVRHYLSNFDILRKHEQSKWQLD